MDLFIDSDLAFEKQAMQVALSEDPNGWPHEVLQELYKQAPYIADFEPHVEMERVEGEQGYGLGHVAISNQSETQGPVTPEAQESIGVRAVRIPIIIKDGMLEPFDLLITDDSKVQPLTEDRLRAAIFRPQAFDVTSRTPGDQSMVGQLYPPYRQSYGFGGGMGMSVGINKQSSALEEFLTKEANASRDPSSLSGGEKALMVGTGALAGLGIGAGGKGAANLIKNKAKALYAAHPRKVVGGAVGAALGAAGTAAALKSREKSASAMDDYLKAENHKHGRLGKKMASGSWSPGVFDSFIAKTASAIKEGSAPESILSAIAPTMNDADIDTFKRAINDRELYPQLVKNAAAITGAVETILSAKE
jgi:hypothetical protein